MALRSRFSLVVTLVSLLAAVASPALADETPPAPGAGETPPKERRKKDDPPKDEPVKAPEAPAPTVEQLLADLADAKILVKRIDAATAAKTVQDPRLLPALAKCLRDECPDVRTAAIQALGARRDTDQRKKAADSLCERLKGLKDKPEGEFERTTLAKALHDLAQVAPIDALLDGIEAGTGSDEVEARCRAVGNVPSPKAIEALISFMSRGRRDGAGHRGAAARALQYATGERAVNDPDQWRAWWKDHEKTFDFYTASQRRDEENAAKEEREARKNKGRGGKKKE